MKLLLLAVSVIAVFTIDSRDFTDKPGDGDSIDYGDGDSIELRSADQDQPFPAEPVDDTIVDGSQIIYKEPKFAGHSSEFIRQIMEEREIQNERVLRGSPQCSANAICGIVGGSCIGNTTTCSGWQVSEGCKGSCKCCIPRSQEMQMTIFTLELQWLKEDLVNSSLQLKADLISMIENFNNTSAGINKLIDGKLDSNKAEILSQRCPEGLFWFAPSDQCFKLLNETKYNWATAKQKCSALGYELAKPYDPVALRHYLTARYGLDADSWIGGQGTGSSTKWIRDGQAIATNSLLWYSGHNGAKSSSHCLVLATHPSHQKSYPNQPYYSNGCTASFWAVCELVRE